MSSLCCVSKCFIYYCISIPRHYLTAELRDTLYNTRLHLIFKISLTFNGANNAHLSECKAFGNLHLPQLFPLNRINSMHLPRDSSLSLPPFFRSFFFESVCSIVTFTCDRFARLSTSWYQDRLPLYIWPSFSSIYPARRGMRHTYLLICVRVYVYVHTSANLQNHFAHEQFRSISATRLRCVFPNSFSSPPPRVPEADTFLGTKGIPRHSCEFQFNRIRFASSSQMMREERFWRRWRRD